MLIVGLVLFILGYLFGIGLFTLIGEILLVVGLILLLLGHFRGPVGGAPVLVLTKGLVMDTAHTVLLIEVGVIALVQVLQFIRSL